METVRAACDAMATRFEVVLHGDNPIRLRAAAEEAFREIQRLHGQLSLYSPSSEISAINSRAARSPVRIEPRLFQLLQRAQRIHAETSGAFDITIAPLVRCWGFMGGSGALPTTEQIAAAHAQVGMEHVLLDEKRLTVQFARPGMMLDLGSIGKGYALECATEILVEAGIEHALVHGGTSTVCAIGSPLDGESWKIAIEAPPDSTAQGSPEAAVGAISTSGRKPPMTIVNLRNEALSVSAVHGKQFSAQGKTYGHVIDPRTGFPAQSALLAAVVLPSATETDALSTALLLGGVARHEELSQRRVGMRSLVVERSPGGNELVQAACGIEPMKDRADSAG